jgi:hypothetical protein
MCGVWLSVAGAVDVPPITYSGQLRADFRMTEPAEGEGSLQQLRTAELNAASYIWQPWFATLDGNFALSQSVTEAEQDSEGLFASGGGSLRVFPISRFPFEAFVNFTDSRTEFADPLSPQVSDFQTLRFGGRQDYRPVSGRSSYTARVERIVQTDEVGTDDITDLFQLSTNQNFEKHRFNLNLNIDRTEREQQGPDTLNTILNGQHNYRPDDALSVETFVNVTDLQQEDATLDNRFTRSDINSFAIWRSPDKPLTVDANARLVANRNETAGAVSEFFTESLRVGARYELSERLRLSGNVAGTLNQGEDESVATSQDATATYQSADIPLRGFSYNWGTSGTASNTTNSGEEAVQRLSWTASHGLNRLVSLWENTTLTSSLLQSGGAFTDTDIGSEQNLDHNATLALIRAAQGGTSSLTLILQDSRIFGRATEFGTENSSFQSATLQLNHFQSLSRYSSWNANLNFQANRSANGQTQTFKFSAASLSYQNSRVFGVRRLRFRSDFEANTESLVLISTDENDRPELSWDNLLEYTIGRLDLRLRGVVVDRAGQQDFTVFLTIRRSFDGRAFDN